MVEIPLVSLLLPAHNAGATLGACLESIRRQTFPRWQCILLDDGSTDDTLEVARLHAARDPRIEIVRRSHQGLVATLNAGIDHCQGAYVARMDADDVMHRDRLRLQAAALDVHAGWSAVGAHVRLFPRSTLGLGLRAYERWLGSIDSPERVRQDAFVECPLAHPTWMVRHEVLQEHRYRDSGWPEDYDLLLRLLDRGHTIGVVPRRLVAWRDHPTRLTRTADAYRIERMTALKAAFLAKGLLEQSETYVLWGYGSTGRAMRHALLRHGRRPSHVVEIHPRRLGQKIHGAPVIPPAELADLRGEPLIASVAGPEPRRLIRHALDRLGFVELRDFVCAA